MIVGRSILAEANLAGREPLEIITGPRDHSLLVIRRP